METGPAVTTRQLVKNQDLETYARWDRVTSEYKLQRRWGMTMSGAFDPFLAGHSFA